MPRSPWAPGPAVAAGSFPGRVPRRKPGVFPALLAGVLSCGIQARAAESGDKNYALVLDYLPEILYDRDQLTVCLRVENSTGYEVEATLSAELTDRAGKSKPATPMAFKAPPGTTAFERRYEVQEARRLSLSLSVGGRVRSRIAVRLLDEDEPWPETAVRAGRLREAGKNGALLVPRVIQRTRQPQRRWKPVSWVWRLADQEKPQNALLLAPRLAPSGKEGDQFSLLAAVRAEAPNTFVVEVPTPAEDDAIPILRLADSACRAFDEPQENNPPDLCAVLLPDWDLKRGTDARTFRQGLELILARGRRKGLRHFALLGPLAPSTPEKRLDSYRDSLRAAAFVYRAHYDDLAPCLGADYWRTSPSDPLAWGAFPNAEGQKKLAQTLLEVLP